LKQDNYGNSVGRSNPNTFFFVLNTKGKLSRHWFGCRSNWATAVNEYMGVGVYTRTVLISTTMSAYIKVQARWLTCDNYAHRSSSRHCRPIYTSEPEIIPRRRHIGPHPDAILLCRQQPVALLLRSGHASSLQILTFGISPIPSQSSWLSFHLVWLASLLFYAYDVPKPS